MAFITMYNLRKMSKSVRCIEKKPYATCRFFAVNVCACVCAHTYVCVCVVKKGLNAYFKYINCFHH